MKQIPLQSLSKMGIGLKAPEDVVVSPNNEVWASEWEGEGCAEIRPDGNLRRFKTPGGQPCGINMDREGRIIIANFGNGLVQQLDTKNGEIEVLCSEVEGRRLTRPNYPVIDKNGNIWCSNSTNVDPPNDAIKEGINDGYLFRIRPDGSAELMAENIGLANGLALDLDESYIYVCETGKSDVIRYPIRLDESLGPPERYGPQLGKRWGPDIPSTELGMTDGCVFDQEGNLWVTLPAANRIVAIMPSGDVEVIIDDPEGSIMKTPTNVSWGGSDLRDLYIGSIESNYILHARSSIPGIPLFHQR